MPQDLRVGIGFACLVFRTQITVMSRRSGIQIRTEVLLGKRKGLHQPGYWSAPGGWLEYGETLEDAAARELKEETGMECCKPDQVYTSSKLMESVPREGFDEPNGRHLITVYMNTPWTGPGPELREPDKCEGWQWFGVDELPEPLWPDIRKAIMIALGKDE